MDYHAPKQGYVNTGTVLIGGGGQYIGTNDWCVCGQPAPCAMVTQYGTCCPARFCDNGLAMLKGWRC